MLSLESPHLDGEGGGKMKMTELLPLSKNEKLPRKVKRSYVIEN